MPGRSDAALQRAARTTRPFSCFPSLPKKNRFFLRNLFFLCLAPLFACVRACVLVFLFLSESQRKKKHETPEKLSTCHVNNKQAREGSPGLEATDANSILFLERCRVHDSRGAGVTCRAGGSVAIVGCELSGSGRAGLLVRGDGRAVLNDSYVYWNGGPGVHVEPMGVMSLEHNDCSLNKGGPMHSQGVIRVR